MKKEEGVAEPATDEKEVVVEKPSSSPASEETNKEETVADKVLLVRYRNVGTEEGSKW